ncbi:polysaccharide lyase [Rhizobium sp. KVB221]|uniref:Polysaccharide lyase n=1 Tax=Rhizobium setariae TaxID=2801340 RepID=A0A936YQ63_9HYPH|nr:polysaccharide lyase [Rhizobium setariae]MBL0373638.1 polysaccharide lyase [Rhizobium setariae]
MTKTLATVSLLSSLLGTTPATADPLNTTLTDGFDEDSFSAAGGLYYRDNEEQRAGTVEFQSAVTRSGRGALKLTVQPNCAAIRDGCSERAEIWEKTALRVPYDQAVWYGFAVKFADPIPQDDHRYLIAQWKREVGPDAKGDFSPFLAIRLKKGKLFFTVETNYVAGARTGPEDTAATCSDNQAAVWLRPDTNQMRALVATDSNWTPEDGSRFNSCSDKITVIDRGNPLPTPDSGWIDFAVMTKPGPGGDGHIEIFANGKWIKTIKGHIGHSDPGLGKNQYFKFGPYRAAGAGAWSMYYDDFRRSPNCEAVLGDGAACAMIK